MNNKTLSREVCDKFLRIQDGLDLESEKDKTSALASVMSDSTRSWLRMLKFSRVNIFVDKSSHQQWTGWVTWFTIQGLQLITCCSVTSIALTHQKRRGTCTRSSDNKTSQSDDFSTACQIVLNFLFKHRTS